VPRSRPLFTNPVHLAVKPADRTSDCCRLTRYGFLDERIIAEALVEAKGSRQLLRGAYLPNCICRAKSSAVSLMPSSGKAKKDHRLFDDHLLSWTVDQHPETQLHDLRQMAAQRSYEIVQEYTDRISGAKARRPGLDQMMTDARRGRFDVVLVWASDRIARSVKHFLDVLDELNRIGVEYVSFREQIDTGGPLGRAIVVIIGAVAELERNLIIERVRAGMRRARLEGQRIGRTPLILDNLAIQQDRQRGQSIREIAKEHRISTATVQRVLRKQPTQAQVQLLDKTA